MADAPLLDFAALDELAAANDDAELAEWARRFPRVHIDTLLNIAWQLHARTCKRATAAQRAPHHLARCTARFASGTSIAEMAVSARFSPCLLLKMLLPALDALRWTRTGASETLRVRIKRHTDKSASLTTRRTFSPQPSMRASSRPSGAQTRACAPKWSCAW